MQIVKQNAFDKWDLPDKSVQAIITSPPYWNKRIYDIPDIIIGGDVNCSHNFVKNYSFDKKESFICNTCKAWKGQYGLEKNPEMFISHSLLWISEAYRVLKDNGIFFLNIGDSFFNKRKQLIPQKIAIEMDKSRWILRNDIIWYKKTCIPESVQDRFSNKYESILFFVKSREYKSFLNNVKEELAETSIARYKGNYFKAKFDNMPKEKSRENARKNALKKINEGDTKQKNPGDVWSFSISCQDFSHVAMWSEDLTKRMIEFSTEKNDIILDPFCGSSTTVTEAEKMFRKGIGFDLGYFFISNRRSKVIQTIFNRKEL